MDERVGAMHSAAMNVGVDSKGYQILVVICAACGHSGHVNPARVSPGKRFRCRKCRSRRCDPRLIWHEGQPPDNVVSLTRKSLK
jgi:hypothetical protein